QDLSSLLLVLEQSELLPERLQQGIIAAVHVPDGCGSSFRIHQRVKESPDEPFRVQPGMREQVQIGGCATRQQGLEARRGPEARHLQTVQLLQQAQTQFRMKRRIRKNS